MSIIVKCERCKRRGKILGAGMMEKECPDCKGIGWVEKPEETVPEVQVIIDDALSAPVAEEASEGVEAPKKKSKAKRK